MRSLLAGILGFGVPGLGHLAIGRRRAGIVFLAPVVAIVVAIVGIVLFRGVAGLLEIAVTPGVLPAIAVANVALAAWRVAAGIDAARAVPRSVPMLTALGIALVLLVGVPHLVAGRLIGSTNDFLDSMFAGTQTAVATPSAPAAESEPTPPEFTPAIDPGYVEDDSADIWAEKLIRRGETPPPPTPIPTLTPIGPYSTGGDYGSLPPLGAAVPWQRPGAVPWGNDGRFDLLLLGSDAGADRWSRRMDVMLLVEIDVATGKVAMVGLPRNMWGAPFPPGVARDDVACGCLQGLLNETFVEATSRHPDRWPGTGTVKGIGAVRSVVSEITGRPIDAVLVADLIGVVRVVDAMGGVDINVPAPVYDDRYPDPIFGTIVMAVKAGQQHMDGRTALFYARSRHQDSDYSRMARQQTLLLAIRQQIGPSTILSAPDLFTAAKGAAWTDLPRESLPKLVEIFDKAAHASVRQLRLVPPTYPSTITQSGLARIRADVGSILGPLPVPTPTPAPTDTPGASPSSGGSGTPEPSSPPTPPPSAPPSSPPPTTGPPTAPPSAAASPQ